MLNVAEVREKPGFRFAVTRGYGDADHASWWTHDDEQGVRDRWWRPRPGEVVLDVGAAFGSYALPALAAGARVVAFCPAKFDRDLLEENLRLNPALAVRCLVAPVGLHREDGHYDPDHDAFVAGFPPREADHDGGQWLPVRSLDGWLADHPGVMPVDWIKIDVEGAELDVLRGAEGCLRRYRPRLLVELHEFVRGKEKIAAEVWAFLCGLDLGYRQDGPWQHVRGSVVRHACYEAR